MLLDRKLQLHTETLRLLVSAELELAVGGRPNQAGQHGKGIVPTNTCPSDLDRGCAHGSRAVECKGRGSHSICVKARQR